MEELQTNCEILWVKLQLKNCKTLFVGAFYRPPETDIEYLTQLDLSLQQIDHSKNIWLVGDFNLPDINWGSDILSNLDSINNEDDESPIRLIPHSNRRPLHEHFIDIVNKYSF